MDREQNRNGQQQTNQSNENQHRNIFKEAKQGDEKNTFDKEQEAALEQERKEALKERD